MQRTIAFLFLTALVCDAVPGQNRNKLSTAPPPGPAPSGAPSGRIVNGQTVSIQNYPFIVGLLVNWRQICGASVITAKHAVSAAHCLADRPAQAPVHLHGGSTSQYTGGWWFPVAFYSNHPNYNAQTIDFDAAVLTIVHSFTGYANIGTIPLQTAEVTPGTWCYAVGWGYTNGATKSSPENLQYTWMQAVSTSSCQSWYGGLSISAQMTCAAYSAHDVCQGDSGGPFVCNGKLTGIVSFGVSGCQGRYPAVFGKVMSPSIQSFIRQVAGI